MKTFPVPLLQRVDGGPPMRLLTVSTVTAARFHERGDAHPSVLICWTPIDSAVQFMSAANEKLLAEQECSRPRLKQRRCLLALARRHQEPLSQVCLRC